ncbi:hypothetical protein HU200_040379 [Digitaria exilis]|uniref:Uncharacterized protein n=1 Tax=Digitaria exilis TaxID=1010633 RepID=A0A835B7J3_9POAL|nr:hypothetical protein HU200_040376 [Digitaria exilis]KAF8691256.1 hypothetical protein HU200_040379 [Digitaria exilis]
MMRARSHLYFAPIRVWHVWLVNRATAASRTRRILHVTAHAANAKQSVLLAIPTAHRKWPWKARRRCMYDVLIDQRYQYIITISFWDGREITIVLMSQKKMKVE